MSGRVSQIQVVHSDRSALQEMIDQLLEERLIACGQLLGPVTSTFRWEGAVRHEQEWLALLKTASAMVAAVIARVEALHSYDVPEILVTEIASGHVPYLEWVLEEARPARARDPRPPR